MSYPIITPEYFMDLKNSKDPSIDDVVYKVFTTPAAIEYAFPLNQEPVIRKLMESEKVLAFKMSNFKPEDEEGYIKNAEEMIKENPVLEHYWNVKIITMNILQNRKYPFEQRMLLLNYAYKTVQGILDQNKPELVAQFANSIISTEDHDEVLKYFDAVKPNLAYSLCDGLAFLRTMPSTPDFDEVRDTVFKNANCDISMKNFKFDEEQYLPIKKAYNEDFLKGREHYIENIMINYVWMYCMPFADFALPLWSNFVFFNTLYNAIKVMLTCYTYTSEDKDEAFVKAVKAFDTSFSQFKGNIVKRTVEANEREGLATNGDMAILAIS